MGLFGKKKQSSGDENAALLSQMMEALRASDFPSESLPELQEFLMGGLAASASDPDQLGMVALVPLKLGDLASVAVLLDRAKAAGSINAALGISGGAAVHGHETLAIEALEAAEALGHTDGDSDRLNIFIKSNNFAAARPLLEKRADDGDADSTFLLALFIQPDEPDQALVLLHRAYELGSGDAALQIGLSTEDAPDSEGMEVWLDRAIELGSGDALMLRGLNLGEEDRQAGEPYLRRAIEEFEHASAMRELGVWEREAGNIESALQLFHQAAEAGNTTAMYDLGNHHEHRMERDEARAWYEKGAEAGDEGCIKAIGVLDLAEGRGDAQLLESAENGNIEAMLQVSGHAFRAGDLAGACQWAHRAGEAGDPDGFALEAIYVEQQGDQTDANQLYLKAAALGSKIAMTNLGNNARRDGDYVAMREWFTKAVDAGEAQAAINLAEFEEMRFVYEDELGPDDVDLDAVVRWYEKAASLDHPAAYGFLAKIAGTRGDDAARDRYIHLGLAAVAGTFEAVNVEQVADENPTTMSLPPRELRERQVVGNTVKLIWWDAIHGERMWAVIVKLDRDQYVGYLDNNPIDLIIKRGTLVEFGPEHILELAPSREVMADLLQQAVETGENPFAVRPTPAGVSREIFQETTARAEAGDIEAIRECVDFYYASGMHDDPEAVRWLETGAALDDDVCLDHLGDHHERVGDAAKARECWRRGAVLGNTHSMLSLGLAAIQDDDVEQAKQWWKQASDAGEGISARNLSILADRQGDSEGERVWQERAIELGDTVAMYNRGARLEMEGDLVGARELFERGAGTGFTACRRALGIVALKEGHTETGLTHLRLAADDDDPIALRVLGMMTEEQNEKIALLTRAADIGDPGAMGLLGDAAVEDQRMGDARMWWERAAELGDVDSFHSLGREAYKRDDIESAITYWERGIEVDPNHAWCIFSRALAGMERGDDATEMRDMVVRAANLGLAEAVTFLEEHAE